MSQRSRGTTACRSAESSRPAQKPLPPPLLLRGPEPEPEGQGDG